MVYLQIKELMENARKQVSIKVNNILVQTYWKIGKIIIEDEQKNNERAEYGKKLLKELSKKLTKEYGKGFSKSNLFNMRKFYLKYQKFQTVSGKLSWSHYCEILSISDDKERAFYVRIIIYALMKSKQQEKRKMLEIKRKVYDDKDWYCLLYTSPSPRDTR